MTDEISGAVAAIMAARPVFEVGDRVRVLSSECEYCFLLPSGGVSELSLAAIGKTGTVVQVGHSHHECGIWRCDEEADRGESFHAHPIWVTFDTSDSARPTFHVGEFEFDSHFAPTELELIAPRRAQDDQREGEAPAAQPTTSADGTS